MRRPRFVDYLLSSIYSTGDFGLLRLQKNQIHIKK